MNVHGTPYRSIWLDDDGETVRIIDQTCLPHVLDTPALRTVAEVAEAIRSMQVRGAPLIGAAAAYGLALAMREDPSEEALSSAYEALLATRPTAVNLRWALDDLRGRLEDLPAHARVGEAYRRAGEIAEEDVAINRAIGEHGVALLRDRHRDTGETVNVLTHCNAGWLATVDWGTALAPVYRAWNEGIPVHVWVDETRPRNQGSRLTAWELAGHGIPHTVIVDNAGGHLMQRGRVDLCLVGTDRTAANGDVANKIGTYLKALAAADNGVPFYVALPTPSLDPSMPSGEGIPIEERATEEVTDVTVCGPDGARTSVRLAPEGSPAANYGFDVTPARLVTALVTERGVCAASEAGIRGLLGRG